MPRTASQADRFARAEAAFRRRRGLLRMHEALEAGLNRRTLYTMQEAGLIQRLGRGLYRLASLPPLGNPDLVTVARKVPAAVICLISALAYHDLTDQIPHQVYLALPRGAEPPRLEHPPLRVFWFTGAAFEEGIEVHEVDETPVRVYSAEKTIADCFKYRNRIGLSVALDALRRYRERGRVRVAELLHYARVCRVERVMRPYLEALL